MAHHDTPRPIRSLTRRTALATALSLPAFRPAQAAGFPALASFSILADMLRQIAGDAAEITALVGPDQDLHGFTPRPSDLLRLRQARLMVINGLGLESWAESLAQSAGFSGVAVVATRGLAALPSGQHKGSDTGPSHAHGAVDPHAWQDVGNARAYIANMTAGLARAEPSREGEFRQRAAAYQQRLDALDVDIRAMMAAIPRARRRILTTHDAFGYFADAYDVDFIGVQGTSLTAEPSPREMARLISQIRTGSIRALFFENMSAPTLLRQIASETGARIGGTLYADALSGPSGPASTYIDMMRHNARTIAEALR